MATLRITDFMGSAAEISRWVADRLETRDVWIEGSCGSWLAERFCPLSFEIEFPLSLVTAATDMPLNAEYLLDGPVYAGEAIVEVESPEMELRDGCIVVRACARDTRV